MIKREKLRLLFNDYGDIVFDGFIIIFNGMYDSFIDLMFLRYIDVVDGFLKRVGNNF